MSQDSDPRQWPFSLLSYSHSDLKTQLLFQRRYHPGPYKDKSERLLFVKKELSNIVGVSDFVTSPDSPLLSKCDLWSNRIVLLVPTSTETFYRPETSPRKPSPPTVVSDRIPGETPLVGSPCPTVRPVLSSDPKRKTAKTLKKRGKDRNPSGPDPVSVVPKNIEEIIKSTN